MTVSKSAAPPSRAGSLPLIGDDLARTGIYALDHIDLFNLMCIPWDAPGQDIDTSVYQAAAVYCQQRRAMLIIDPPTDWTSKAIRGQFDEIQPTDLDINGPQLESRNCAVYFPRIKKEDLELGGVETVFPACGAIANQEDYTACTPTIDFGVASTVQPEIATQLLAPAVPDSVSNPAALDLMTAMRLDQGVYKHILDFSQKLGADSGSS